MKSANSVVDHPSIGRLPDGPKVKRAGGLLLVDLTITGISPLLQNAMTEDALLRLWTKEKPAKNESRPEPREAADSKVYRLKSDGKTPVLPQKCVYASFIEAGKYVRLDGKRQVSTAKGTILPGLMWFQDAQDFVLFRPGTKDVCAWEVDLAQGRNPNGGEGVCIVRPRFDAWEIHCVLGIDLAECSERDMRDLVEKAVKRVGFCDHRPQRKGTFGRGSISKWAPRIGGAS
jgi:hypothetical protein